MPYRNVLLATVLLVQTAAEFTEIPHSVAVNTGEVAIFQCQHPKAQFDIYWKINELPLRPPYPPGITTPTFGQLHIRGHPVYNGTRITCVAFIPFPTVSPTVTLTVYTGFMKLPMSLNLTLHQEAVFTCELKNAGNIIWTINNTEHTQHLPPNTRVDNNGSTSVLRFPSCINNTAIECQASYGFGLSERSPSVSMKCQGLLGAIHDFVPIGINITWEAPFSLDLTNVPIDIGYCFDMYNVTCGGRVLKTSDCDVNETHYIISPDMNYVFELIISARSNVPNSENGTSFSRKAEVIEGNLTGLTLRMLPSRKVTVGLTLSLAEKESALEIRPPFYSVSATPIDGVDDATLNCSTTAESDFTTGTISLTANCSFPIDRVYSVQVWAFGCYQHLVSGNSAELSTHRVQVASIQPLRTGGVQVTGKFLNDSDITGFLAILYSTTEVHYYHASKPPNKLNFKHVLGGHVSGPFAVSIFATGEDNLPLPRAIGTPRIVKVKASQDPGKQERVSIEYSIVQNSTGVDVTCKFESTNLTSCVVLIHQQISQLGSSGLVSIASFNIRNKSGGTAHAFFPGVDLEHYHVGVVGGKMILPPPGSDLDGKSTELYIIGIVLGTLSVIFVMTAVVPGVLCCIHALRQKMKKLNFDRSLRRLQPHASKWFSLGKALSIDENQLMAIYNRTARDDDSLKEMLILYMARSDQSWKKIEDALKTIKSSTTAVQTTTRDYPGQGGLFVSPSETTFEPTTQKSSNRFIEDSHLQERKVHGQCQEDLTIEKSQQTHTEAPLADRLELVVSDKTRPYRRTGRRDVTRNDLLELPLETSPPTLDDNDTTIRFSGRAGEHTPPTINSPTKAIDSTQCMIAPDNYMMDIHERTSGPRGNVEKQEDATNATYAITISPTEETSTGTTN